MLETAKDSTLDKAITKLKYFSENEQLRFDAISREKYINDRASLERSAKPAGRSERDNEILANLKSLGMSDEQIKSILK